MSAENDSNVLVRAYRRYIGPGTPNEAIGYWIFFVGAILGVAGIIAYLYSTTVEPPYDARQLAVVLSSIGLMMLLLGVVIRLPANRRVTWVAIFGAVVTLLGTIWFVIVYPEDWATPRGEPEVIAVYTIGIALVVASAIILPALLRTPPDVFEDLAPAKVDSKATFELFRDRADDHRWRLRHDNGNIIASSGEGYSSKQKARQGLESVRKNVPGAPVVEITRPEDASQASFELYEDNAGEWRWRLRHDNGNIIADSGEGYVDRSGAQDAIERVKGYAGAADTLTLETGAFDMYQDQAGEWRWRLLSRNGRIIADSGEGYASRSGVRDAIERVRDFSDDEFEVYEDAESRYRWRLIAQNNEIIADSGQGYSREQGAKEAVDRVRSIAPQADTLTLDRGGYDLFEDDAGEWRWRLLASNGQIIADSGEGYSSRAKARQGLESVRRNAPDAPVQ